MSTAGSSQQAGRGEWVDPCLKWESHMRKDNKVRTKNWALDKVEREENPFLYAFLSLRRIGGRGIDSTKTRWF